MSTTLQYNGVDFGFIKTHKLQQTPEYDPTGCDRIFTWNDLEVETILYINPATDSAFTLGDMVLQIKAALSKDRQPMLFTVNGIAILTSNGADEANGPNPKLVAFDNIVDCAFRVVWKVRLAVNECQGQAGVQSLGAGTPQQLAIASLRWEQTQDIDISTGYSTITTTGLLIARRNILQQLGIGVDDLRAYIKPPLINGFTRTGRYTVQPDGLRIQFTLVDVQKQLQPPAPIVSWEGTFAQTVQKFARWWCRVDLTVRYQQETDRQLAIAIAWNIALNRFSQGSSLGTQSGVPSPSHGVFQEHLTEPVVSIRIEGIANATSRSSLVAIKSASGNGKVDATGGALQQNSIALGMGSGVTPSVMLAAAGPNDLTQGWPNGELDSGTAMLEGLRLFAQTLQDECTSLNAAAVQQQISTFSSVSGWARLSNNPVVPVVTGPAGNAPSLSGSVPAPTEFPQYEPNLILDSEGNPTIPAPAVLLPPTNPSSPSADPTLADYSQTAGLFSSTSQSPSSDPSLAALIASSGKLQNVTIGYITDAGLGNNFVVGNQTPGIWTNYYLEYEWIRPGGRRILPATVPGVAPVAAQIFAPYWILNCQYECEREGGPPEVPSPRDYPNFALLDSSQVKPNINRAADGQSVIYKTEGRIQWLWLGSDDPTLFYPIPPWCGIDYDTFQDVLYDSDDNLESAKGPPS